MDYRNLKGEIITYIRALFISAQYCPILTHFARYFGIITFSRSSISIFYNFSPLTVSVRACVCVSDWTGSKRFHCKAMVAMLALVSIAANLPAKKTPTQKQGAIYLKPLRKTNLTIL